MEHVLAISRFFVALMTLAACVLLLEDPAVRHQRGLSPQLAHISAFNVPFLLVIKAAAFRRVGGDVAIQSTPGHGSNSESYHSAERIGVPWIMPCR